MAGASTTPKRTLVGMVPNGLATSTLGAEQPDGADDPARVQVADEALGWQTVAGDASFWEASATFGQGGEEGRAYALAGLIASAGEQLALAHAASIEVLRWKQREADKGANVDQEMCMRAQGEAQSLFVLGASHALGNVAIRALALDQGLCSQLVQEFDNGRSKLTLDPFSNRREDWMSLNKYTARIIRKVAKASGKPEVIALADPVVEYALGNSFNDLIERRGADFHRWRPQSYGMTGVPPKSPWKHKGNERSMGMGSGTNEDAKGLAEEVAKIADAAMFDLTTAMSQFSERLIPASPLLGGAQFVQKK